jgi:hypothetical protein
MHTLWRDPAALGTGQLWRLLSPVLVQSDPSARTVIEVFLLCAVVGVVAEHKFSRWQWIASYLTGALVGHGIGEVFQPTREERRWPSRACSRDWRPIPC